MEEGTSRRRRRRRTEATSLVVELRRIAVSSEPASVFDPAKEYYQLPSRS